MIRWMHYKWLYFLISSVVIVPGLISLFMFGLKPSIDFTGGSLLEYKFTQEVSSLEIQKVLGEKNYNVSSVQKSGDKTYLLKMSPLAKEQATEIKNILSTKFGGSVEEVRFEVVGPTLGRELLLKTIIAIILAASFILFYIAWRFRNTKFGVCAVFAMIHDALVILGSFSLLGHFLGVEVDTLFVTALLTILSFSVHDTVIVYDRIRESQKLFPQLTFESLVDKAITETLSRSLNNSLTVVFMLVALLFLGGVTIKWFVTALLIGMISGTYSSTFNAAPLMVIWENFSQRRKTIKKV